MYFNRRNQLSVNTFAFVFAERDESLGGSSRQRSLQELALSRRTDPVDSSVKVSPETRLE